METIPRKRTDLIGKELGQKLRIAREGMIYKREDGYAMSMPQNVAAVESGWNQTGISAAELGKFRYIPTQYLEWLASKNINLQAMFDPNVTATMFKAITFNHKALLPEKTAHLMEVVKEPCQECKRKDDHINRLNQLASSLERHIDNQAKLINTLEGSQSLNSAANGN
jgi:hypothetical protein